MYTLIQEFHNVNVQSAWNSHLFQLVDVHVVGRKHSRQLAHLSQKKKHGLQSGKERQKNALHEMNRRRGQSRVKVIWDLEVFALIYFADSAVGQYHRHHHQAVLHLHNTRSQDSKKNIPIGKNFPITILLMSRNTIEPDIEALTQLSTTRFAG